ncbi:MAG: hypothetical protein LC768_00855 [Acidobacteria bacterium]|nr:hypothetical protein [Acidobacteriota bacterium]MCA1636884.1 hypothetical protein [Acidobacteriota bacterium]
MMSNLRLMTVSAASGALLCGFVGAIAARGTNVLLPGLGLVIAGPIVAGLTGLVLGSMLGLFVAAIVILTRRKPYP